MSTEVYSHYQNKQIKDDPPLPNNCIALHFQVISSNMKGE